MEALVVLLLLLVVGGFVFAGVLGFGLFTLGEKSRKKATARAHEFFGDFDGRDLVQFRVNMETPDAQTMIAGAHERGYTLTSRTDLTPAGGASDLVFERRA